MKIRKSLETLIDSIEIIEHELNKIISQDYTLRKRLEENRPRCNKCGVANMRAKFRTKQFFCRSCGHLQGMYKNERKKKVKNK